MSERSSHPYGPYIPQDATKLIIGTMPPYRFCVTKEFYPDDVDFYYGSRDNSFWPLVSAAAHRKLHYENTQEAVDERKKLLADLHMGIADIVQSCIHQDGKASDNCLLDIQYLDLRTLLKENPKIDTLIYTQKSGTGHTSIQYMINNPDQNGTRIGDKGYHEHWDQEKMNGSVVIGQKTYHVHLLHSPSPNGLRRTQEAVRQARYNEIFRMD